MNYNIGGSTFKKSIREIIFTIIYWEIISVLNKEGSSGKRKISFRKEG